MHLTIFIKPVVVVLFIIGSFDLFSQTSARKEGELTWYTNIMEAQTLSQKANKPIFAFFTGSDWCGWCHRLQRNVFAKKEFIEWAKKNVILLELDYPRGKQLPAELAQQNAELQQVFQVRGFPTIWMFFLNKDSATQKLNIAALGTLGYPQGAEPGKEEVQFIKQANEILASKPQN